MFDVNLVQKWDLLQYRVDGKDDLIGNAISFFQGKYVHSAIYVGDLLYKLFCEYLTNPTDDLRRVLSHSDGLLPDNFTKEDVEKVLQTQSDKLKSSIFESHIESGIVIKPMNEKWYPLIDVYRIKLFINEARSKALTEKMISMVGMEYDLLSFPGSWLRFEAMVFGWKHFSNTKPLLSNAKGLYCSAAVCTVFEDAIGYDVVDGLLPRCTPPSAISKSERVSKVC